MKKKLALRFLMFLLCLVPAIKGLSQVLGDFQTKNPTGNWSDFNAWNIYNGVSWQAATAGQIPTATSSVFVLAGQTISVDNATAACKNLNVNGDISSKVAFSASSGILNVTGNIVLFSPTHNCFGTWQSGAKIVFSGTGTQSFTNLSGNTTFSEVQINKSSGVVSAASAVFVIDGTLDLTSGGLNIGAGGTLTLNGPLISSSGILSGTSTSDLNIIGTTGGSVLLPVSGTISLQNITVTGTRTLVMDGTHDINLFGIFNIGGGATYDNGGESQVGYNSGASIDIFGKFLNRDKDNFNGTNGAIPGNAIITKLETGCTIEYGLNGDQNITARIDYYNITFSGSGVKTLANTIYPSGTVFITANAIVNTNSRNFGDGGMAPFTNFTMDGGRLILTTISTQPYMTGTYNLTGGVVEFASSQVTAQTIRNRAYQNIEVTGNNVGNSSGNITLNTNGTFTVKTGGAFTINDNNIVGAGTPGSQAVTVENGATFKCGNNKGFNGYLATFSDNSSIAQNITNINLHAGSIVQYTRDYSLSYPTQPITNANGLVYSNLSLSGTSSKIAPPGILTVQGNLSATGGAFLHNGGTVLLNGAIQTFTGLTFYELQLANGVKQTSGSSTIIDSIKVNDGATLSISNGDMVTLHSDATKTARIGQLGTGNIVYNASGKFVIERYISGHRAWRFLSVPVTSQTIHGAWQENGATGGTVTGLGTQITGPQGIAAGFDLYSGTPSIKTFNSSTNDYDAVTATAIPFNPSKGGYMLFVRGDRNTTYPATSSTTLRTTGMLFTGNQGFISVGNQFTPVNNPYASQIDMVKLSPDGITYPAFYVWDPNLGGTYGYGAFVTFLWNPVTSHFDITNSGGSYADGDHVIDNGQAFLVSTLGTGFSIPVTENVKTDVPLLGGLTPFTPVVHPGQQLRTLLYTTDDNNNYYLADGVLNNYGGNFSNNIDGMDARKYLNAAENLSIARNGALLGIERRQTLDTQDTIFFQLSNLKPTGAYRLVLVPAKIDESGLQPCLEDSYLHTRTPLRLNDSTEVNFINDGSAGSIASDRFRVIFQAAQGPLPLTVTNVKAYTKNEGIAVEWNVDHETGVKSYVVEKSADGTTGFVSSDVIAANDNGLANNYSWLDGQPFAGYNYYRIKIAGISGQVRYSKVVRTWEGDSRRGIAIYPNPVANGLIHILFNNQPAGKYTIRMINKWGQVVFSKQIQHTDAGKSSEVITIDEYIAHGVYRLELINPGNGHQNINVVY